MKILYCAYKANFSKRDGHYYCDGTWPYFVPALARLFVEMYLMVPVGNSHSDLLTMLEEVPQLKVIETKAYQNRFLALVQSYCWSLGNVWRFRQCARKVDAIVLAVPHALTNIAYLPFINKPLVLYIAGDEQEWASVSHSIVSKVEKSIGMLRLREVLEDNLLRLARIIICQNEKYKRKIVSRCRLPESKIRVVPSGINVERFKPMTSEKRSELRRKLGLDHNLVIGYVAKNISYAKGADLLLEAFARLKRDCPKVRLILIGKDKVGLRKQESVIHYGSIKPEDLAIYYNAMDVFVYPTRSDASPKVIKEAMACGVPVISTRVGGPEHLVSFGETGFIVPIEDIEGITVCCQRLAENDALRIAMGKKARAYAVENFDYRALVKKVAEAIDDAIMRVPVGRE